MLAGIREAVISIITSTRSNVLTVSSEKNTISYTVFSLEMCLVIAGMYVRVTCVFLLRFYVFSFCSYL